MQLHTLQTADAALDAGPPPGVAVKWTATPAVGVSPPRLFAHDLPTRVAALSWLHTPQPMLLGAADSKVFVWAVGRQDVPMM